MFDSYNRDDMDIEIIQTSPDIVITKNKQSNVQTSPDIVITKNKQSSVHSVPTIQPGSHRLNRSINPLDVNIAALRADNLDSTHRWRFITT